MRQKIIAGALGVGLLSLAAVGAFASQDFVHTQADPTGTATETATEQAIGTPTPEATETEAPEATETEAPEATKTEKPEGTESPEGGERDIKGIPTTNANFHDADSDGVCDHGEAIVKTTTAGTQVRVPCEAEHGDSGHGHAPDAAKTPETEDSSSD